MTAEQQLERSVLESKERDELHAIAQALSVKTTTRTKKADIIDGIYGGKCEIPVDTVIRFQDGTTQRIRTTLAVVDLGREAPLAEAAE